MIKHNLLIKKLNKQILSINYSIENSFNKLRYFRVNYKKIIFNKDNRLFLACATFIFLTLFYFLIPTFYNKDIIQAEIENHINKKYDFEIKFDEKIKYGILPKPHFVSKKLRILKNKKEIAIVKDFKAYLIISKFFKINKVDIEDLTFRKADFNLKKDDLLFFINLLKTEPNEKKIIIKDSNIFYKDKLDEVVFINKIFNSEIFYDSKNLKNVLFSKNKIFNIPYNLKVENDKFNKNVLTKFSSKKIRVNIENNFIYDEENNKGILDISFINKSISLFYEIKDNLINFKSKDIKNLYSGIIEIKPFYFSANLNYDGISTKNLFDQDSLAINLIKSEIFNNKNLNGKVKINLNDITNINELNNLSLIVDISEGKINFSESNIMWKDDLKITLNEGSLNYDENQINLNGKILLEFLDMNNFYRSFQIQKKNRKDIKQIELYFLYDFNRNKISLSNPKIDKKVNLKIEEYVDNFNVVENDIFNKIRFKNFVSGFFSAYDG